MPTGTTVSFNPNRIAAPGAGSSTMTITVGANTAVGTYPITVTGNGGGIQQSATVTLTVTAAANFTLTAAPASLSVVQGNAGNVDHHHDHQRGLQQRDQPVGFGDADGHDGEFQSEQIAAPGAGSSTMTITVGANTAVGTYPITVTGNGGGIQQSTTVTLTVTAAANFTLTAAPASLSVVQGNAGTSTITTTISGGFNSAISLSASGMPTGTTVSFNPSSIAAPGAGTSTMTITVGANTAVGAYPITVTGNGGGIQQSATVTLTVTAAVTSITYVQGNYATPQTPQTTVSVTFTAAQTAGDLNVVVVGWNDSTAAVSAVTDSKGNTYTRAVGPTVQSGIASQSIYYAKNIAAAVAGTNTVTVTFASAATYPDVRILEYSGADPNNPVDVTAANSGSSATSSSGSATTTNATDLIFGANLVQTGTTGPGSGFTRRLLTSPDGDIAEDQTVTATGIYSATAPVSPSGQWIMQMVAFRTPGSPVLLSIAVTPVNPSITVGAYQQFTATGTYSDGSHQDLTNSVIWTSSAPTIATISSGGLASGLAAGSTTIQAASGSINGSTSLTVTVQGSFTMAASPTSLSVGQGNQGTSTITTTISGGFNSAISLSASGMPTGTAVSFNPSSIAAPGAGSSTMTITVGTSTTAGTYPITVTGNGGGIQQTATVTLTVTVASNFAIAASPASLTVGQNNQGTSTITTTISGGFNSAISLSASGMPTGTTVSFNPSSIAAPGAGISTMTITVGSNTAVGTYPITVTGNGGGTQQSTTVTLTVATITAPTNVTVIDGGPPPIVDAVQSYINSTFLTVHTTAPFDSTGGDLIVMFASSHAGVSMTPSDNLGNTWVAIAGPTNTNVGFDLRSQVWYVTNPIVGPGQTVSLTLSAPESLVMSIFVVKGTNISSPVDAVSLIGSDNGTQSVNVVSPNITTTTANDLLMGWVKVSAGAVFTSGTGFTQQPGASSNFLDAESGTAAAPGVYNATFALNTSQTWQSDIVAANNNSNQTTLSWTASTENGGTIAEYLVERCQGTGCTSFVQVGTPAGTSYNDNGLTASASYSYRVRAEDTSGNIGPYSSVVSITTPPTIPSLPGNLTVTTSSLTEIDLSWVQSTETNGTIGNYFVERCQGATCTNFTQIGTSTDATYSDTGLTSGTTYNYRVRAQDTAGNVGPYSNVATGTTVSPGNFTLTAAPPSLSVVQGNAGTSTITTTISGGFNSAISLSASGMPTGTTVSFNPSTIAAPGSGNSTMTITVGSSTAVGTYPITVTGNGGGIQQTATVTLTVTPLSGGIGYVQGNYATPQTPQTAVNVTYTAAQSAGDLNVVVVGWNDSTASVSSVTDSKGNAYTLAVGPTVISGTLSQSIYYSRSIAAAAAGANTVTVTFSTAAEYPDIRILEYSGADPNNPVDVTAANTGNSSTSSSGSATTTNPTDLIFGANIVTTRPPGPAVASPLACSPPRTVTSRKTRWSRRQAAIAPPRRFHLGRGSCRWWPSARPREVRY